MFFFPFLQLWEQQKQLEEQRREKERLEALRKKDKHDHSAVASTEVKQRLQVSPISIRAESIYTGQKNSCYNEVYKPLCLRENTKSVSRGSSLNLVLNTRKRTSFTWVYYSENSNFIACK